MKKSINLIVQLEENNLRVDVFINKRENLKIPINYFYEDYSDYLINQENLKASHMNINYNFLVKMFSELTDEQKIKLNKNLQVINTVARTG